MMLTQKLLVLVPVILAVAFPAKAASVFTDDECKLEQVASLDMTIDSTGRILVPMTISGKTENMLIDTGAAISLLTRDTAKSLNLYIGYGVGHRVFQFFGGAFVTQAATATNVELGQMKSDQMNFGIMPQASPPDTNGLIGQDILRHFDLDFDFANSKLNLISTDHCPGRVVYWTKTPVSVVSFSYDDIDHIVFEATLDNKRIEALLDTGAYRSVGDWETISDKFGLQVTSPSVKQLGQSSRPFYTYPFQTLSFEGVTINNPDIILAPKSVSNLRRSDVSPLVIGINVIRQLHVYVASKEENLYITPATAH
jgi:predicted aspartyl protease